MKPSHIIFLVSLVVFSKFSGLAQEAQPIILDIPQDWRYEKIDFPLDFAKDIAYQGFEELRFAPGMFDASSSTYFTYIFAVSIHNKVKLSKKEITDFLSKYYKGLCDAVANSKKLSLDTSKIKITIEKTKISRSPVKGYTAQVLFLDAFTNGQEVLLNMDLEIIKDKENKKSYILALVSPQSKDSDIWTTLRQTKEKIKEQEILQVNKLK